MRLDELASQLGARLLGPGDTEISGINNLKDGSAGEISFVAHNRFLTKAKQSKASAHIVSIDFAANYAHELDASLLVCENHYLAFAQCLRHFAPQKLEPAGIHRQGFISPDASIDSTAAVLPMSYVGRASIGAHTTVMPFAYVGDGVQIGNRCHVGVGAVLQEGTVIDDEVLIAAGAIIGADGFVYAPDGQNHVKLPAAGQVKIDSHVEIGANSCVDRGTISITHIGQGTKLDNLVQIGHDVTIGENVAMAAQGGIGGHAAVGAGSLVGGQVGIKDHAQIGENVHVGAKSFVTGYVECDLGVTGIPAMPHEDYLKSVRLQRKLRQLFRRVKELENQLAALTRR